MQEKLEKYISTGSFKSGLNRIKVGMLPVLFQKRLLNGKYCGSNCLIFAISTFTGNMSFIFCDSNCAKSVGEHKRVFLGKNFSYKSQCNVYAHSTYALCS